MIMFPPAHPVGWSFKQIDLVGKDATTVVVDDQFILQIVEVFRLKHRFTFFVNGSPGGFVFAGAGGGITDL